jgi:hypothetical protein
LSCPWIPFLRLTDHLCAAFPVKKREVGGKEQAPVTAVLLKVLNKLLHHHFFFPVKGKKK